ncbi:hypothetical protein D3C84_1002110 [compost metagenome]
MFRLDEDGDGNASLLSSDIMLSDWSGAALEFAFGLERPVIFADVPRKVLNPDYTQIGLEPLEVQIRHCPGNGRRLGKMAGDAACGSSTLDIQHRQKW